MLKKHFHRFILQDYGFVHLRCYRVKSWNSGVIKPWDHIHRPSIIKWRDYSVIIVADLEKDQVEDISKILAISSQTESSYPLESSS